MYDQVMDSTDLLMCHYDLSDTCATAVVLVAALIGHFTGIYVDGYCGALVGVFIMFAGIGAAKDTLNPLLGQQNQFFLQPHCYKDTYTVLQESK